MNLSLGFHSSLFSTELDHGQKPYRWKKKHWLSISSYLAVVCSIPMLGSAIYSGSVQETNK